MKTNNNIPAYRFQGYTDAWELRKLGEVASSFDYGLNSAATEYDGENKYLRITDIDDDSRGFNISDLTSPEIDLVGLDEYRLNIGDIVFARTGASVGKSYIYRSIDGKVYFAGFLIRAKIKDNFNPDFVFQNTLTANYERFISITSMRSGQPGVNAQEYSNYGFMVPTLPEQKAIGTFFSTLDQQITLHQCKLDTLKEQKKTYLKLLFPDKGQTKPALRFQGFEDDWEEVKLGEVLEERNVQQLPQKDIPLVSFTVENGVTPKTERYDREFMVRTGDKKYKYTELDDIVYNPANLKFGAISRNKFGKAVFSPIYVTLVVNKSRVFANFIEGIVTQSDFIQKALQYQEGTVYERMAVKVSDFLSLKISLPSLPEQEAIGTFFQTLDQEIAQVEDKLASLKEMKKTLLHRIFV
ncbi:restriction endonuclease subunit S [Streptococcus suis]|uniref:restriction endonuclease subunit S n=1 Tax=Streptococcus suis TaxID=1307 RepID=UPI000CF475EC|nr:restriction endonuclease subunit S [Streptococcus suis]